MTVTYNKPELVDPLTVRLAWTSDETAPVPFRVYREGALVGSFDSQDGSGEWLFSIEPATYPFIEVLDRAADIPAYAFPGRMTLNWTSVSNAVHYRVEENVSAVWTLRETVPHTGQPLYTWRSRWLEDDTSHQFRVIPVDAASNQGTALSFTALMIRHPDSPDVGYTYNGSGTPTVTIAAN